MTYSETKWLESEYFFNKLQQHLESLMLVPFPQSKGLQKIRELIQIPFHELYKKSGTSLVIKIQVVGNNPCFTVPS